jgi:hypothetical protein
MDSLIREGRGGVASVAGEAAVDMVQNSTELIAEDIRDNLFNRWQDLIDPEAIGSAMKSTTPLAFATLVIKKSQESPYVETPRVRTGQMVFAIVGLGRGKRARVVINNPHSDQVGHKQQNGFTNATGQRVPARPFFGVSDSAVRDIAEFQKGVESYMNTRFAAFGDELVKVKVKI